jgi:chaperonin cofactor prefoldin
MKLYELSEKWNALQELDEVDAEALENALISIEGGIREKAVGIGRLVKNLEADEEALKNEMERLRARKKTVSNKIDGLKYYLETNMKKTGLKKLGDSVVSCSIQRNPPRLKVVDEEQIPSCYYKPQPPVLDKKALLDDLKAEGEIPGAVIEQTESLRIR